MAETVIRDKHLMIIGYIEDGASERVARNKNRKIVGYYNARDNYTRDHQRMIVGTGDQLMGLIHNGL
jgi:hypothetical protein